MVVFSLTLVRHGETTANKNGVIQGHQDVALSEVGKKQARLVAQRLQNENFTHIFASDLSRATQTAQTIADGSTACCCALQFDKRLRERTFGEYEGKTFKELFEAAQKSNQKWPGFTPIGAETCREVKFRAKSFFRDLCETMAKSGTPSDSPQIPTSFSDRLLNGTGLSNGTACYVDTETPGHRSVPTGQDKTTLSTGATVTAVSSSSTKCTSLSQQQIVVDEAVASKRPRTEDDTQFRRLSLDRVVVGGGPLSELQPDGEDGSLSPNLQGVTSSSVDGDCVVGVTTTTIGSGGTTTMARSNSSSSSGCSSLHDSVECAEEEEGDVDFPGPTSSPPTDNDAPIDPSSVDPHHPHPVKGEVCAHSPLRPPHRRAGSGPASQPSSGGGGRWQWEGSLSWFREVSWSPVFGSAGGPPPRSPQACPNVSLSPMMEHRLTSISSVSSGRNSSFDDADAVPLVAGEVLVVSHGGLIKELVAHFIEDFNCKVPGGKGHALRVCPNTGVSRFTVTLEEEGADLRPAITCLLIHDKDHLGPLRGGEPAPTPPAL